MPLIWAPKEADTMPEYTNYSVRFTAAELRSAAANTRNNPKMVLMLRQGADAIDTAKERAEEVFRLHARIAMLESQLAVVTQ